MAHFRNVQAKVLRPICLVNRLKILQDVIDRNRQSGPLGMNNQSRGRTGNRLLPASLTDQALNIIRERDADFGPTLAREKLAENHGIVLGKETLRRLMIKTGLWVPRKQRAPKIQQPRYRRACCGELSCIERSHTKRLVKGSYYASLNEHFNKFANYSYKVYMNFIQ